MESFPALIDTEWDEFLAFHADNIFDIFADGFAFEISAAYTTQLGELTCRSNSATEIGDENVLTLANVTFPMQESSTNSESSAVTQLQARFDS
jgi:hypothetical protein